MKKIAVVLDKALQVALTGILLPFILILEASDRIFLFLADSSQRISNFLIDKGNRIYDFLANLIIKVTWKP